jgi:hypothetical protein
MFFQHSLARPAADGTQGIQHMKERLYESLSKSEKNFLTANWRNRVLIQHLARHVNPRPRDYEWYKYPASPT